MTVLARIVAERAALVRRLGVAGVSFGAAVALGALALGAATLGDARWLDLPAAVPFVIWVLAAGAVALGAAWAVRSARRDGTSASLATVVEREMVLREGAVRVALEVGDTGALGRLAARQMAASLDARGVVSAPAMRRRAARRAVMGAAFLAIGVAVLIGATRGSPDGWRALRRPIAARNGSLLPRLQIVTPGPRVLRGSPAVLRVRASGRRSVVVLRRATGGAWITSELPVKGGVAVLSLPQVDADLAVVATDGRASSDTARLTVTDRPFVGEVSLRAEYPAYLGRAADVLPAGEPVRVPRGTTLAVTARATAVLSRAALALGSDTAALTVNGRDVRGRIAPDKSGAWSWVAATNDGPIADLPTPIEIEVLADSAPIIEIVSPSRDTLVGAADRVTLTVAASDDRAIADITLLSTRVAAGQALPGVAQRLAASPGPQWNGTVMLDLAARGLLPGDELRVVAVATDASPWHQQSRSRELVIRLPDSAEQRAMARSSGDSAVAAANAAVQQQKALSQKTSEAAKSRGDRANSSKADASGGDKPMTYEQAEKAKALAAEQRQLGDKVKQAQDAAKKLESQLKQAGALDSTLQRQLREVQQLLKDALTPELAAQLRKLEQAAASRSANDSREAMGDLAQQQQRLREQLERSAEMLKRAALEGSMQTLRDEARELAQKQRALGDSLGSQPSKAEPAQQKRASDLSQRTQAFEQDVADLQQRLQREKADAGAKGAEQAKQKAAASAQGMQRAAEQGDKNASRASAEAKAAAEQMQQAGEALAKGRQAQIGDWKRELSQDLDQSAQEMLQMARQQQQLADRAKKGENPQEMRGEQSALQQGMQQASERMNKAGQKSSLVSPRSQKAMADARRKVEQATKDGAESRAGEPQASDAMKQAADALNQAASSLVRDRERTNSAQSASGFAEAMAEMQKLAGQQGGLNAQTAGLMPGQSAGSSGQGQQAADKARQLAQQQRQIARQLEQVGEADASGKAEELAREARQIAQAMETSGADRATVERQQRLFRRMLDAGRSMEKDEKDESGKRESRAGDQSLLRAPSGGTANGRVTRIREPTWTELRGLSAEDRRLIVDYFRKLNASPDR